METSRTIDVTSLDAMHRRVLEDMISVPLQPNQRIIVGVSDAAPHVPDSTPRRAETLDDWRAVYEGLSESQIEEIDRFANTRADPLTSD